MNRQLIVGNLKQLLLTFQHRAKDYSYPLVKPPVGDKISSIVYGFSQPFLAFRFFSHNKDLLKLALLPSCCVVLFCVFTTLISKDRHQASIFTAFYATFLSISTVPPVLFAKRYSKLAVEAYSRLGFGIASPAGVNIIKMAFQSLRQMIIIAIGLFPLLFVLKVIPSLFENKSIAIIFFVIIPITVLKQIFIDGSVKLSFIITFLVSAFILKFFSEWISNPICAVLSFIWFLQWIVVDVFENAKVNKLDIKNIPKLSDLNDSQKEKTFIPIDYIPWFARIPITIGKRDLVNMRLIKQSQMFLLLLSRFSARLSKGWLEELYLIEKFKWIALGFAISAGLLLITPILNLFFRPILIVASVHLTNQLIDIIEEESKKDLANL